MDLYLIKRALNMDRDTIFKILEQVPDPEIPIISIKELGILQDVKYDNETGQVTVYITPTYTGCPAMDMITVNIKSALEDQGLTQVNVVSMLEPIWTTDWITDEGRQKLLEYGIAPPAQKSNDASFLKGESPLVHCPQCNSSDTEMISLFGSTACKSLYKCKSCLEPFDYFKCH